MRAALHALFANVAAGARMAVFARVERGSFVIDAAQLVLLLVFSAVVDGAIDFASQPVGATFDVAAVGAELASFAALVAVAALLAWAFADDALALALPIVVLASLPLVQVANLAPEFIARVESAPPWAAEATYYLVFAWFVAVLTRAAFTAMQPPVRRAWRAVAATMLLLVPVFVPDGVLPHATWFSSDEADAAVDAGNAASEPVLSLQRALQEEALDALNEHTPGDVDLYFVGFAPDGNGATWRPRIEQARKVMDGHWGTSGRSIAYVNDVATLTESPMATVTHLREALDAIASTIDPDEDVLMLYVAARSNADGSVRVWMPPLGLVQLTGPGLAHLLREAGVRWRIVVLSTCSPKPFVDALADAETVVVAAPADGCARGAAPTALGDALFGESLAGATSVQGAIEGATRLLEQRGVPTTLHVGQAIAPRLSRLRVAPGNRTQLGGSRAAG